MINDLLTQTDKIKNVKSPLFVDDWLYLEITTKNVSSHN
jgi:hypothetical protein